VRARALPLRSLAPRRRRSAFIRKNYKALKAANPTLPVLIRECSGTEARLTARFGTRNTLLRMRTHAHAHAPPSLRARCD
jgi:hypothetical protein